MSILSLKRSIDRATASSDRLDEAVHREVIESASPKIDYASFIEFASQCVIRSGVEIKPFTPLYPYQDALVRLAEIYPGFVICKDRQLGVTESLSCWMLSKARDPAYAGVVFSITDRDAGKVSKRIARMPERVPGFKWEVDSIGLRKPVGGGELNFRPSTEAAARGLESVHTLFFDESGFTPNISEMYASSVPSQEMVGKAARTFIVSTVPAVGRECWFWEQVESNNPDDVNIDDLLALARSGGHLNRTKVELPEIPGFIAFEDKSGWIKMFIGHKAHPVYGSIPDYVEHVRVSKKLTLEQAHREHNLTLPIDRAGNPLINYFDENRHVQSCEFNSQLPIHLSFDFNRHPATCLMAQVDGDRLIVFEEFYLLNSDTFALAKAVRDRVESLSPNRILIHGDASGRQRTANSQQSNWDIVSDCFKSRNLMFIQRWGTSNPAIVDTVNSLNFLFMEGRAIVSPRCAELIKDLKTIEDDGRGGINKKKDLMRSHLLDCLRYLSHGTFPYKSGPKIDWILD